MEGRDGWSVGYHTFWSKHTHKRNEIPEYCVVELSVPEFKMYLDVQNKECSHIYLGEKARLMNKNKRFNEIARQLWEWVTSLRLWRDSLS